MTHLALAVICLQTQGAFKETATIGKPYRIGSRIMQGGREQDWGNYMDLTFNSARVELHYPCKRRVILADAGHKIVIFNVTLINASTTNVVVGGDTMPMAQLWDAVAAKQIRLENYYDPKTKDLPTGILKKGQSATFDIVMQFPAGFSDFRVGFSWGRPMWVAWLNLSGKMGKSTSVFAPDGMVVLDRAEVKAGKRFDLGPLALTVEGTESDSNGYVAKVAAENIQAAECRWGWQYVAATLVLEDGTKVSMYPTIYDASGKAWIGDLKVGQVISSRLNFSTSSKSKPVALEIKWIDTKRTVRVTL